MEQKHLFPQQQPFYHPFYQYVYQNGMFVGVNVPPMLQNIGGSLLGVGMQNPLQNSTSIYKQKHEHGCMVACSCGIYKSIPHNHFQDIYKQRYHTNQSTPVAAVKKEKTAQAGLKRKYSDMSENKNQESRNLNS